MLRWIIVVFAGAYVVLAVFAVVFIIRKGLGPFFHSKRQKKTRVKALIKHKIGRQEFNPVHWKMEIIRKILVFQCEDGIDREYDVHDDVWDWVDEGDDGVLIYQGELFVDFDARRPRHDLTKAQKRLMRT